MHLLRQLLTGLVLTLAFVCTLQAQVVLTESGTPDYAAWDSNSERAEDVLEVDDVSETALEQLRLQLSDWRAAFLDAQSSNEDRIETIRSQIEALGAVPEEGEATEAEEITTRRTELQTRLSELLVPVRRAEEAYLLADDLIDQIDTTVRERQTQQFLQLEPSPVLPQSWPVAAQDVADLFSRVGSEVTTNFSSDVRFAELKNRLPFILLLIVVGFVLILRSSRWIDRALAYIRSFEGAGRARFRVGVFFVSLVAMGLPILGLNALIEAIDQSQMVGIAGTYLLEILTFAIIAIFVARWLARQIFPPEYPPRPILDMPVAYLRRGRVFAVAAAIVLACLFGLDELQAGGFLSDEGRSVLGFPVLLFAGITLFRFTRLPAFSKSEAQAASDEDETVPPEPEGPAMETPAGIIRMLLSRGVMAVALLAPVLGAIGYTHGGTTLITSTLLTLGLLGAVAVLQRLARDIYAVFAGDARLDEGLIPVLISFVLALLAFPFLILIWGARVSDLTDAWAMFESGISFGETRISPTNFLTFAVVFAIGYVLTRLLQGTLRTQVLPKTDLDMGSKNAALAGTGYIGIFLAALIAITTAGIDLSGLAIVAGALSVGIGFGLQTIVSNFVSGIILLIERPISEGDWIEVGSNMGIVRQISVRATRIETFDRRDVIVPNADLISTSVTNWTKDNLNGRLIVPVGVAYGTDTRQVEKILLEIAKAHPVVILRPPPGVFFVGFGADSLDFEIRAILRDVNYVLSAASDIRHEIAKRFAEEGIEVPFAQRDLWIRNPEAIGGTGPSDPDPATE